MAEGNDLIPFGALAFGEDGGFFYDLPTCFLDYHVHTLQCGAGADYIVHNEDLPALQQLAVLLIKDQCLRLARGNG